MRTIDEAFASGGSVRQLLSLQKPSCINTPDSVDYVMTLVKMF